MHMQKQNKAKRGFTLIELMVVISVMGILASIALPNVFGVVERSRQRIDLLRLFYLRDAIDRALIESEFALYNSNFLSQGDEKTQKNNKDKLDRALKGKGVALFVLEVHNGLSVNVQGSHGEANNDVNMCQLIGSEGTFYTALKDAGFEGVAEIVKDRLTGKSKNYDHDGDTYTSKSYWSDKFNKTDYRTAPKNPLFISRALNIGKKDENTRYTLNIRWVGGSEKNRSVDVYLLPNKGAWNGAFRTDEGVCFSTIGPDGCATYQRPND